MSIEAEVLAVSAAWDAALVSNDAAAFADFVTNDWVYIDPNGATTRTDVIAWIASGKLAHHMMHAIEPPRVALHGETAILTSRKASTGTWEGVVYAADEWITEVFVRTHEGWRCALSHKCPAWNAESSIR